MRTLFGPSRRRHQVLLDADDRGRRHPGRHQPDRLDRRGRLRDLPARPVARRRPVGPDHGGRAAARHPADRAVRGAPHRGRHLQLRLGHDDRRHAVPRHGPGAPGRAAGRRLHRQGRARGDPRRRASTASSSASRSPATRCRSSSRASATRCHDGEPVGTVTDLIWSPRLEKNIGYVWVPIGLVGARQRPRDRGARRRRSGRRRPPRSRSSTRRRTVPLGMTAPEQTARPAPPLTADEIAAVRKPYRAASLLPGRAYHDPAIHDFERTRVVPARLDRRRPRGGRRRRPGRTSSPSVDDEPLHRRPRPGRRPARLLQRLPPPRHGRRRGAVRQGGPLPVPVPRLDLRPRRHADPGQAHRRPRRLHASTSSGCGRPGRDVAGLRLRQPRPGRRRRCGEWLGDLGAAPRPVRLRGAARRPHGDLRGRRQLEVHRRELQRVLPLPGHPPAAQQADAVRPRRRLRARTGRGRAAGWSSSTTPRRWPSTAATAAGRPAMAGITAARRAADLLLPDLAVDVPVDPPGLPARPPARAGRRRTTPGSSATGCSSRRRSPRPASTRPTRSRSGTSPTARTGTSASSSSAGRGRAAGSPAATRTRSRASTRST